NLLGHVCTREVVRVATRLCHVAAHGVKTLERRGEGITSLEPRGEVLGAQLCQGGSGRSHLPLGESGTSCRHRDVGARAFGGLGRRFELVSELAQGTADAGNVVEVLRLLQPLYGRG